MIAPFFATMFGKFGNSSQLASQLFITEFIIDYDEVKYGRTEDSMMTNPVSFSKQLYAHKF